MTVDSITRIISTQGQSVSVRKFDGVIKTLYILHLMRRKNTVIFIALLKYQDLNEENPTN